MPDKELVTIYRCKYCGTEYSSREQALLCENGHDIVVFELPREHVQAIYNALMLAAQTNPIVVRLIPEEVLTKIRRAASTT